MVVIFPLIFLCSRLFVSDALNNGALADAAEVCAGKSRKSRFILLHKHISFHGGTGLCAAAQKFRDIRTAKDDGVDSFGCNLNARHFSKHPPYAHSDVYWSRVAACWDFVMFESDFHAHDVMPFPRAPSSAVRFSTVVRHPMPLLAKVCHQLKNPRWLHSELRAFSTPAAAVKTREDLRKWSFRVLESAKTTLNEFDIVMVLDHFEQTSRILCLVLGWNQCEIQISKNSPGKEIRMSAASTKAHFKDRSSDPVRHARGLWGKLKCTADFDFDELLHEHAATVDFWAHATGLAHRKLLAFGVDPGFAHPAVPNLNQSLGLTLSA